LIKHSGKTVKKFGKYSVIDCRNCKFIHVVPVPSNQELNSFYGSGYFEKIKPNFISKNEKEMNYWNLVFDEKLATIEKFISSKSKRILDIGSGPGFFLRRAKRRGWDVVGVEPSPLACDYANKQNIHTIQKFFHEVTANEIGKFDAIHTFDVLEHVNNPIDVIEKAHSLLKKGGIIVVEVPNDFNPLQKLAQKALKKKEWWITLSFGSKNSRNLQHLNYFNFSSISDLIKRTGFKIIIKESTFPIELFLLMGQDYIKNPKIGKKIHLERIQFEKNFVKRKETELKRTIYQKLAEVGIGRTAIIYAKKF
jgi:2-polyprenyl-3-methyl-5-hydroxy-6-metoxy-1,4-benzoquinol methylase|tara:strand:- start:98 stop:1021 length:924 start_codon:yes stop_codon:yes gene_type:complete